MELGRPDPAILDHPQANGRATAQELGDVAHLSPSPSPSHSPSHRRQKLLEEARVIKGYVALLDQDKVGPAVNVFVTVKLANHQDATLRGFEQAIEACPEVMEMYEMTGAADVLLRVVASDIASYEAFLRGRLTHIPRCGRSSRHWR